MLGISQFFYKRKWIGFMPWNYRLFLLNALIHHQNINASLKDIKGDFGHQVFFI